MVATMFQRLLRLPEAVRARHDTSSLKVVMHGAAPTPPAVKRAMVDWWGPVFWEYYAATEGNARFRISSHEWLRKPGSVGKLLPECGARVLNEAGEPTAPGVVGEIYFRNNPAAPFEYFNAPEGERGRVRGEHFSVGDLGYVDEDGYLFLVGRTAERIISGGVNIYPQEIDDVLIQHPAVRETCTVGAPNEEWGEEVRGVVVLNEGYRASPELAQELIAFVRTQLAGYKAPRRIDFVATLPRSETGKLLRRAVRQGYWAQRSRQI
jgi:long-chain acyl-CoA synthetase